MGDEELSMRDALDAAYDEVEEKEEAGGSDDDAEESTGTAEEEEASDTSGEEKGDIDGEEKEEEDTKSSGKDSKEEDGDEDEQQSDSADAGKGEKKDEDKSDGDDKSDSADTGNAEGAPVSWSPAAREQWKDVPEALQSEILKREKETMDALGQSTSARRFAQEFSDVVRPYEPLIAARGATPMEAVKAFLNLGAGLQAGTPTDKAQIITNLIRQYSVDVKTLDEILAGQPGENTQMTQQVEQMVGQRMKPYEDFMQQQNQQTQRNQQTQQTELQNELDAFSADKKNEFFSDVRLDMADLMGVASNRGKVLSLEDAYNQACRSNPEIFQIIEQRAKAAAAKKSGTAERRRNAAGSIRGKRKGTTDTEDSDGSVEGDIRASWAKLEGGGRRRI